MPTAWVWPGARGCPPPSFRGVPSSPTLSGHLPTAPAGHARLPPPPPAPCYHCPEWGQGFYYDVLPGPQHRPCRDAAGPGV